MSTQLWNEFLHLPQPTTCRRISKNESILPGETKTYSLNGKGCIKHWWFTYMCRTASEAGQKDDLRAVHKINLKIHFDHNPTPHVDQPLDTFFGTFLDLEPLKFNSAPLTVLNRNGFNSWFPMPFADGFTFQLTNNHTERIRVWFLADVHLYAEDDPLTPLRFATQYKKLDPAEDYTFMEMGEISGKGFIAGIFHGTDARGSTDAWYHTGGDTWLLDGETQPAVLRGNGGEDVVGYSFGIYQSNYLWQGAPYVDHPQGVGGANTPCIFYRFFGPDAIVFNRSALCKFGTKAARIETNLYYYSHHTSCPPCETIKEWHLCGPFDGGNFETFQKSEFPETEKPSAKEFATDLWAWQPNSNKPVELRPKPYRGRWVKMESKRGWIDFLDFFRGINYANTAAGGNGGAAYALGWLDSPADREVTLHLSYDDWIKVWVNDEIIHTHKHDHGFAEDQIKVLLKKGSNKILIKLSNALNQEFLAWAFHLSCHESSPRNPLMA